MLCMAFVRNWFTLANETFEVEKMRGSKCLRAIVAFVLTLLLILPAFTVLSNFAGSTIDTSIVPTEINVADCGDLLQYEWPQIQGDLAFTRFSAGLAPEAPDILWKKT